MTKILVIDDDPDILEAVQLILTTYDYDTAVTAKGDEVYRKVKEYQPDIIILDILLSGYDGRTICRNLKNEVYSRNIPVIMISAHPSAGKSVKECGADSFLPKPFSVETLLKEVSGFTGQPGN